MLPERDKEVMSYELSIISEEARTQEPQAWTQPAATGLNDRAFRFLLLMAEN
jgi:hypothetical protein